MGEKYHYKDYIKSLKKKLVYKIAKGGAINKRKSKKLEKTLIKRNYIDELKAISQSNKSEEEFKDDLNEIVKKYPESRELIENLKNNRQKTISSLSKNLNESEKSHLLNFWKKIKNVKLEREGEISTPKRELHIGRSRHLRPFGLPPMNKKDSSDDDSSDDDSSDDDYSDDDSSDDEPYEVIEGAPERYAQNVIAEMSPNLDTFFKKRFKRRLKHILANKPLIPTNIQESLKELDEKGMELKKKTKELEKEKDEKKKEILKEEIDEKDKILKEKIDELSRILSKRDKTVTILEGHLNESDAGEKPIKITLNAKYESGPILVNIGEPGKELPTTGSFIRNKETNNALDIVGDLYKYDSAIKVNIPVGAKAGDKIYINKSQIMMPRVPMTFDDGEIYTPKKLVFEIHRGVWKDSKNIDSKYNIQKNVDQKSLGFYDPQGYHGYKKMVLGPDTIEDAPFEKQINLDHYQILHDKRVEKIKKEEKEKKEKEEGYEEEKKSKSDSPIPYTKFRPGSAKSFEKLNDKWRVQWSKTNNKPYYVNLAQKSSQWTPPPLIGQQPMGQPESEEKEKKEKDDSDENDDSNENEEEKDDSDENDDSNENEEDVVSHRFDEDDLVEALYMDGEWYNAKIQSLEADGRYFIEWTDPRLRHGVSRSSKFTTIDDDELRETGQATDWSAVEKEDDEGVPEMKKDDEEDESQESSSYSPSNVSSLTTTPVNNDEEDESQESSSYSPSNVSSLTTTPVKVAESSPL